MDDQENNLITLQDEDGNDIEFEHLMTLEHEGGYYIVLEATTDQEDCKAGEAIILKILKDDQGEDYYATIEDEQEFQRVFDRVMEILEDEDAQEDEFGEYDEADEAGNEKGQE